MRKRKMDENSGGLAATAADSFLQGSRMVVRKRRRLSLLCACLLLSASIVLWRHWMMGSHSVGVLDRLALKLGLQRSVYVAVIDAGSTGTRVLAFHFHHSRLDGSLKLAGEFFKEVKPGLSSYADQLDKVSSSVLHLLAAASRQFIPGHLLANTPVMLRATAGLRLLPAAAADNILATAGAALRLSGFQLANSSGKQEAVAIMSGVDEGLFSWFTINFLLDRLSGGADGTVAVLDLGGGSVQVTFAPVADETACHAPADHLTQVAVLSNSLKLYSKSYLGGGLMAARHAVFSSQLVASGGSVAEQARHVVSSCVNPIVNTLWKYAGQQYNISGDTSGNNYKYYAGGGANAAPDRTEPVVDYLTCLRHTTNVTANQRVHALPELQNREVYAISYFFDRASEAGLVDPQNGGRVSVEQLMRTAHLTCLTPNVDQPLACLDLTYITALLHQGLGLPGDQRLHLRKKIDGHETSWALGAAYHLLASR